MINVVKKPHAAIFTAATDGGKTKLMLDLIQNEYRHHFDNIVILCPTLRVNETYKSRPWIWSDDNIFLIIPKDKLFECISRFSKALTCEETLFVIDDCIGDDELNKQGGIFSILTATGRHINHTFWFLIQRYKRIPITIRDQIKMLFVWFSKNRYEFDLIHNENYIIEDDEELKSVKLALKEGEFTCVYLRMAFPRSYKVLTG